MSSSLTNKRKKSSVPRHKRLNRASRLQAAKQWILNYNGKNIIRGYKNHFGVDLACALHELEMLGIQLSADYINQIKRSEEARLQNRQKHKLIKQKTFVEQLPGSDDVYYFIAGYTENEFSYGITWDDNFFDLI
ncbi:hypothetical protein [Aneurinibacillus terranovensis]|uniref:hypothetical protein n=1 Tax=Aneurinibacillus terranovensis TaxID=278991 RepID=UPI0003F9E5D6|nr:hypothetical protein [Aneurinibacillus terranovensis]